MSILSPRERQTDSNTWISKMHICRQKFLEEPFDCRSRQAGQSSLLSLEIKLPPVALLLILPPHPLPCISRQHIWHPRGCGQFLASPGSPPPLACCARAYHSYGLRSTVKKAKRDLTAACQTLGIPLQWRGSQTSARCVSRLLLPLLRALCGRKRESWKQVLCWRTDGARGTGAVAKRFPTYQPASRSREKLAPRATPPIH